MQILQRGFLLMSTNHDTSSGLHNIIKAMGLVFGDIGTSPLYTLTALFVFITPSYQNIFGALSLISWTLILLVFIKYAALVMSLSKNGEGGTIVLKEILLPFLKSKTTISIVSILAIIETSLLIGDSVLTPAMSILSAVEGLLIVPGLANLSTMALVYIAALIAIGLFSLQSRGSDRVAKAFGPIMLLWFTTLSIFGLLSIIHYPAILGALNPIHGIIFLYTNGIQSFFILSFIILCATGAEAMYADMGHLGRKPILQAWYFVFIALIINYMGQGAFLLQNPRIDNVLFSLVIHYAPLLYLPFLVLSIFAAIIASQALISGVFSIVYQAITTRIMPPFRVDYTSTHLRSQIYISFANWFLLGFVLIIIVVFKQSVHLAAAYGLAVAGGMLITGTLATMVFYFRKELFKMALMLFLTGIDLCFLISMLPKIPQGGYWSIVIALFPLVTILIYTSGQKRMYHILYSMPLKTFLKQFNDITANTHKIEGCALFFLRETKLIPSYIIKTMLTDTIVYEDNILITIALLDVPYGYSATFEQELCPGLRVFKISAGYMQILNIERILKRNGINEKVIFYGIEDIVTRTTVWKAYSIIKKLTPSYVQLYKLPVDKLHGVITRVEL